MRTVSSLVGPRHAVASPASTQSSIGSSTGVQQPPPPPVNSGRGMSRENARGRWTPLSSSGSVLVGCGAAASVSSATTGAAANQGDEVTSPMAAAAQPRRMEGRDKALLEEKARQLQADSSGSKQRLTADRLDFAGLSRKV